MEPWISKRERFRTRKVHTITTISNIFTNPENLRKLILNMHPQAREAKRFCFEGIQPLELITFATLPTVLLKGWGYQHGAKMGAKMERVRFLE